MNWIAKDMDFKSNPSRMLSSEKPAFPGFSKDSPKVYLRLWSVVWRVVRHNPRKWIIPIAGGFD